MPLSVEIQYYVDRHLITSDQAHHLSFHQCWNLENQSIRELITDGWITVEQAIELNFTQRRNLESRGVRELLTDGIITVEQVMGLDHEQRWNLELPAIRELITDGWITVQQAIELSYRQVFNLESRVIRNRIADGIITVEQALELNFGQLLNLGRPALHQPMFDAPAAHNVRPNAPINNGQSTHNASVHQAVSESATRLAARYQLMINGAELEQVISRIKAYVRGLPDNSQKNTAAKRCVKRITAPDYSFDDFRSNITTRQLLALTFLAIDDDNNRVGSLHDARAQFIEGLYEIQRGYNLSGSGVDDGGQDRAICTAGTFNKLIEKLQGIHPDCQIRFITKETTSLKLPIVVREEAMRHLECLANQDTKERASFTQLIAQVEEEGVDVIWSKIEGKIAERMFDEFGSLYQNKHDHAFIGLIDAGQYADLGDLSKFKNHAHNSPAEQDLSAEQVLSEWEDFPEAYIVPEPEWEDFPEAPILPDQQNLPVEQSYNFLIRVINSLTLGKAVLVGVLTIACIATGAAAGLILFGIAGAVIGGTAATAVSSLATFGIFKCQDELNLKHENNSPSPVY